MENMLCKYDIGDDGKTERTTQITIDVIASRKGIFFLWLQLAIYVVI